MLEAFLGFIVVLMVLFSIAFASYISFFKTSLKNGFLKLVLSVFLSVCIFLLTSVTSLLILWPPM